MSFTLPYGVNFEVIKGSHLLTVVYANPGVAPSPREQDAVRALAALIVPAL